MFYYRYDGGALISYLQSLANITELMIRRNFKEYSKPINDAQLSVNEYAISGLSKEINCDVRQRS